MAHSLGEDTEIGVAKVTMLMAEDDGGNGQERDHTGMDRGGGGGTGAVCIGECCGCWGLDAMRDDEWHACDGCTWNAWMRNAWNVVDVMKSRRNGNILSLCSEFLGVMNILFMSCEVW